MSVPRAALALAGLGLIPALVMVASLRSGVVRSKDRDAVYRDQNPGQFYTWIFFYAFLALLFIGAGIFLLSHPHFRLVPAAQTWDD